MGSVFSGSDVGDFYGFVYNITNLQNGRQYIGRKYFWQNEARSNDKTVKRRRVTSEATATTMDLVQSLNRMLRNTEKNPLEGLY